MILFVTYPGIDDLDVLSYNAMECSISDQESFEPRNISLPSCDHTRSRAYCRATGPTTIEVTWYPEDMLNTKNKIHTGTLIIEWEHQKDVFMTIPKSMRWVGDDGYIAYPTFSLVRG